MQPELYIRQTGLIDPVKLNQRIAIIGGGSIGGWTALCLGKLGCSDITVYDFDAVEIHNAGSQVFKSSDEGQLKTDALRFRLEMLLEEPVKTREIRWTAKESLADYDIVIAAVDSITVRKELFEYLKSQKEKLYIDARMAGNALEIYTVDMKDAAQQARYAETLFDESEALPIRCSERSVVYNVFSVASWIGNIVAKYANGEEIPSAIELDLYNMNLFKTI